MLIATPEDHFKIRRILIVTEEPQLCRDLKVFFEATGYQVTTATNGHDGLDLCHAQNPDLIIAGLHILKISRRHLLTTLAARFPHTPKMIICDTSQINEALKTFDKGCWDFISTPISSYELVAHKLRQLEEQASLLQQNLIYKQQLEQSIEEKLGAIRNPIIETQKEIVSRLSDAIEVRSREAGNHARRVAEMVQLLALEYGLDPVEANTLRLAAPLHDIGKAGIPDIILTKNGKLVDDEFEIIKTHTTIGYEMLKDSHQPIIQAAATIALQHHEHWDGSGYPSGLAGEEIHIYGRITCLADIYDVLLQKRQHKESWNSERALEYVKLHSGTFFDPDLVQLFLANIRKIAEIVRT